MLFRSEYFMKHFQPETFPYEDIVNLTRPISPAHPPMPKADRAAQFAPFAALTDYHEAIREATRFTDEKKELDEQAISLLSEKLHFLQQNVHLHPKITILYFLPDRQKAGGTYLSATGFLKKIDRNNHVVILQNGTSIPFDDIIEILDF